jgi:hypothetical protein
MDQGKPETLGQAILNLHGKTPDSLDPIEISEEMGNKEYADGLNKCIDKTTKNFPKDFYITAIRVEIPLMQKKAYKLLFKSRLTCPSPQYDEDAWKYHSETGSIEFLWSVPDIGTCHMLRNNALIVDPEERQLRDFAIAMLDGDLLKKARELNGEKEQSNVILSFE